MLARTQAQRGLSGGTARPLPGTTLIQSSGPLRLTRADGIELHCDSSEHIRLIARILGVSEEVWRSAVRAYGELWSADCHDLLKRARRLGEAYSACSPHLAELMVNLWKPCPLCRDGKVLPVHAKAIGPDCQSLQYGRCEVCGHGILLSQPVARTVYQGSPYYTARRPGGTGYETYEQEMEYRERKGARLLDWIEDASAVRPRSLLEVGSGFGFTRKAAERRGIETQGLDINPYAAERARALYGMHTYTGTLSEAERNWELDRPADLIVYQFVLEHIEDPAAELREAARVLDPAGLLVLSVPSMDALELDVFGASYRSFRPDHSHIFSRRSIRVLLNDAGYQLLHEKTDCGAHLLAGFYSPAELQTIYGSGLGPDLHVIARKQ